MSAVAENPPVVYAIGGPDGAGQTTFAREFLPTVGIAPFLNADSLAAGLSPLRPEAMAVPAARLLLKRWRALVAARTSFAFESTFSGRTYAPMLRDARAAGYSVQVCYLWLVRSDQFAAEARGALVGYVSPGVAAGCL